MNPKLLCLPLLLLACTPRQNPAPLLRQPLQVATTNGWHRVVLDREAQRAFPKIWLGDASGSSVPYVVERDGLWEPRELSLSRLALGRDPQGNPTAEFGLKLPEGWQGREREQLRLKLDLEGAAPWVCEVALERRVEGQPSVSLERQIPEHLYDLGQAGHRDTLTVPWDLPLMRLTLRATQGKAPKILGLRVTAATEPQARAEDLALSPRQRVAKDGAWDLHLDAPERIVGAEIRLKAPVAPLAPAFSLPERPEEPERHLASTGLLWNLPALSTRSERVALDPISTDCLRLRLPEGAAVESLRLLVRREVLLFPAESGQRYFLHHGGGVKPAPGQLSALPTSSRELFQRAPLGLGTAEADPQGLALASEPLEPLRRGLPAIAALGVLLLGFLGWRLLRSETP